MDGSRLLNAAVGLGLSLKEIAKNVDSVSFCFSKVACICLCHTAYLLFIFALLAIVLTLQLWADVTTRIKRCQSYSLQF